MFGEGSGEAIGEDECLLGGYVREHAKIGDGDAGLGVEPGRLEWERVLEDEVTERGATASLCGGFDDVLGEFVRPSHPGISQILGCMAVGGPILSDLVAGIIGHGFEMRHHLFERGDEWCV
jgi:hypothetical protein